MLKDSDLVEGLGVQELAGAVLATGKEHCLVSGDGDGENLVLMDILGEKHLLLVEVVVDQPSLISAIIYGLVQSSPLHTIDRVISWCFDLHDSLEVALLLLSPLESVLEVIHAHGALSGRFFSDNDELLIREAELHLLSLNSWKWAISEQIAIMNVEDLDTSRRSSRQKVFGVLRNIDRLAGVIDLE